MNKAMQQTAESNLTRRWFWSLVLAWTLIITGSFSWNMKHEADELLHYTRLEANALIDYIIVTRAWNARHGGVYVPSSEASPPNPHLKGLVPERDITTPQGRALTLINPAYMTRQINEILERRGGRRAHITSLKPIRPENVPDTWESKALNAFEQGAGEFQERTEIDGKPYMRLMRPLFTEKSCLKCHAQQGYKEGDIRGGISASLPMADHLLFMHESLRMLIFVHGFMWLLGLAGIRLGMRQMSRRMSEQEKYTRQLRDGEEHYRGLFEQAADYILVLDVSSDGAPVILDASETAFSKHGYSRDELIGKPISFLDSEASGRKITERLNLLQSGESVCFEVEHVCKDGSTFIAEAVARLVTIAGKPLMYSIERDITGRKQAENALRESEEKFRSLAENSQDYIMRYDEKYRHLYENPAALRVAGLSAENIIGKTHREAGFDEVLSDLWDDKIIQAFKTGEASQTTFEWKSAEGMVYLDWRLFPECGEDGYVKTVLSISRDVTKLKQAEIAMAESTRMLEQTHDASLSIMEDLEMQKQSLQKEILQRIKIETQMKQLLDEIETKNRELEHFTFTVSHDLKAPLLTINGFLGQLEKDIAGEKADYVQDDVQRIRRATAKMRQLLDGLLELSRIGRIVNPPEDVALNELVKEALVPFAAIITEKKAQVIITEFLPVVRADRSRLLQVYENLIGNALKYSADDKPVIEIGVRQEKGETVFFVKDNGMGIKPELHEKVFELFVKLDAASDGTGIGLALCKRIIEAHDCRIWVESEGDGKGSMFCFTLPLSDSNENSK